MDLTVKTPAEVSQLTEVATVLKIHVPRLILGLNGIKDLVRGDEACRSDNIKEILEKKFK